MVGEERGTFSVRIQSVQPASSGCTVRIGDSCDKTITTQVIAVKAAADVKADDERSSSGASSGFDSDDSSDTTQPRHDGDCEVVRRPQFFVRELQPSPQPQPAGDDLQLRIAEAFAQLSGQVDSPCRNRYSSSLAYLNARQLQADANRGCGEWQKEDRERVVLYATSMGVVRATSERCARMRTILETLLVRFEERDVFLSRTFQRDLRRRLPHLTHPPLPQLFVAGIHLGDAELVEQLNEIGVLRDLLSSFKKARGTGGPCGGCGGHRFVVCGACRGSKRSPRHRHSFAGGESVELRCGACDAGGLVRCPLCLDETASPA